MRGLRVRIDKKTNKSNINKNSNTTPLPKINISLLTVEYFVTLYTNRTTNILKRAVANDIKKLIDNCCREILRLLFFFIPTGFSCKCSRF